MDVGPSVKRSHERKPRVSFSSPDRSRSNLNAPVDEKSFFQVKGLQRHHSRNGKPVVRLGRKTKGRWGDLLSQLGCISRF